MFDFRRITLFCLEKRLSKHKMTVFSKNFGGHGPFAPLDYAYGHCPVALPGYAPCGNRILIAGYRPAQEFVIERSSCAHRFGNSN